jgi:hypothetical protein
VLVMWDESKIQWMWMWDESECRWEWI